jgi:hypothetical protein
MCGSYHVSEETEIEGRVHTKALGVSAWAVAAERLWNAGKDMGVSHCHASVCRWLSFLCLWLCVCQSLFAQALINHSFTHLFNKYLLPSGDIPGMLLNFTKQKSKRKHSDGGLLGAFIPVPTHILIKVLAGINLGEDK